MKMPSLSGFSGAVLTQEDLRLELESGRLTVSPILIEKQVGDGSIDISLGTQFITSSRPDLPYIDPRKLELKDIQRFQRLVVVPFDRNFILHPGSFLLGSTLEFVSLPCDICGFVLSR